MSKRSVARPRVAPRHDPEAIALRVHQIASVVGVLAAGQDEPLSHALYLIEECLLDVETRVESLRRLERPPMMPPTAS